ncbi:hypothetical protein J6590_064216 [Homalodisca vitripennis]|nr:hypothetical protein J6590_064216 [Homalodisca vitripennis]
MSLLITLKLIFFKNCLTKNLKVENYSAESEWAKQPTVYGNIFDERRRRGSRWDEEINTSVAAGAVVGAEGRWGTRGGSANGPEHNTPPPPPGCNHRHNIQVRPIVHMGDASVVRPRRKYSRQALPLLCIRPATHRLPIRRCWGIAVVGGGEGDELAVPDLDSNDRKQLEHKQHQQTTTFPAEPLTSYILSSLARK